MIGIAALVAMLLYAAIVVAGIAIVAATPFYLLYEATKGVHALRTRRQRRRPDTRAVARAEAELREQYASGMLTLVGLEERFESLQHASSHLEVASLLDDLPPVRPRISRPAACELVGGVVVLLLLHGAAARALGAVLVLGSLVPPARWRVVAAAFLAGVALLAAPLAALPLGIGAGLRFLDDRRP